LQEQIFEQLDRMTSRLATRQEENYIKGRLSHLIWRENRIDEEFYGRKSSYLIWDDSPLLT
jgi:hypothetical protein